MRDNRKEDAVGCEITRKRTLGKGGGADKRGGAHSRYQFFRCGKMGGGGAGINDGGRSGGTLRYLREKYGLNGIYLTSPPPSPVATVLHEQRKHLVVLLEGVGGVQLSQLTEYCAPKNNYRIMS